VSARVPAEPPVPDETGTADPTESVEQRIARRHPDTAPPLPSDSPDLIGQPVVADGDEDVDHR
jgi:hypothetical protein